jgi:Carbohydrate binding domain
MRRKLRWGVIALTLSVWSFVAAGAAKADQVVNGGFETGDFTGWNLSGNTDDTYVLSFPVHSGYFAAGLSNDGTDGYLSQTISTLTVGQQYQLSYWLYSDGYTPNEFSVSFGGATLFSQTDIPYQPYTEYTYLVTATSTSSELTFGFQDAPGYLYLDDVSLNAVPEPSTAISGGVGFLILIATISHRRWRKANGA